MTDLPKWPRLLVAGEPVTREQANEILIRTESWLMVLNDRDWEETVNGLAAEYGFPVMPRWGERSGGTAASYWEKLKAWRQKMGVLSLEYLSNARIASPWVGGPKGWCAWDGRIGCSTYNVGKWPTLEQLTAEWEAIAAAFPYLKLHAQVLEVDEEEGVGPALATWAVMGGRAALVEPVGEVAPVLDLTDLDVLVRLMPGGERGVTAERLREALAQVAKAAL